MGMMKMSVLLLLVLPALSLTSPLGSNTEQGNDGPRMNVDEHRQKRQLHSFSEVSGDGFNLEWVTWTNSLPNDAVSIDNEYVDRIDYVCKYMCEPGFYTPSKGPYCQYPNATEVHFGFPFEILVNKNNVDLLEWKEDSSGSVPKNAVRSCPNGDNYVGKDSYGLGKVATSKKHFYLPWKSTVYQYSSYQVLTINENVISQEVFDVRYNTNGSSIFHLPPETVRQTSISNYECRPVVKTNSLSKMNKVEHSWDLKFSVQVGVKMTFTAGIPMIFSGSIGFSTEVTFQYSKGKTVTEAITDSVSVEISAPPNQSCMVNMVQYKFKVDIPFTALLRRTYGNGDIQTIPITGTYEGVQVGEIRAVADRCAPLINSKSCT